MKANETWKWAKCGIQVLDTAESNHMCRTIDIINYSETSSLCPVISKDRETNFMCVREKCRGWVREIHIIPGDGKERRIEKEVGGYCKLIHKEDRRWFMIDLIIAVVFLIFLNVLAAYTVFNPMSKTEEAEFNKRINKINDTWSTF